MMAFEFTAVIGEKSTSKVVEAPGIRVTGKGVPTKENPSTGTT